MLKLTALVYLSFAINSAPAWAEDTPTTPEKVTIPGTGGYVWGSGPPEAPHNMPPNQGGSVGVQYPPDKGPTKVYCNGKPC
jgi:hypothetical protein